MEITIKLSCEEKERLDELYALYRKMITSEGLTKIENFRYQDIKSQFAMLLLNMYEHEKYADKE